MSAMKTANVNVRIQETIKVQAEQILETMGISRATAIDMFYRQIILNNGIPFPLKIPKHTPVRELMDESSFNLVMSTGYRQAIDGESSDMDDVFEGIEKGL